jgi:hypothetical protein
MILFDQQASRALVQQHPLGTGASSKLAGSCHRQSVLKYSAGCKAEHRWHHRKPVQHHTGGLSNKSMGNTRQAGTTHPDNTAMALHGSDTRAANSTHESCAGQHTVIGKAYAYAPAYT